MSSMHSFLTKVIRSCALAIWRLAEMVVSRAGMDSDPTWNMPSPALLSLCEIYIAALTASVPFFWPIISKQLGKIFVSYEFEISTEPRYRLNDVDPSTGKRRQSSVVSPHDMITV
jgi:hypothetical protein